MRRLMMPLLLLVLLPGCRRPALQPAPAGERILVRFLDRDASLALPVATEPGTWHFMDAGRWEPLDLRWKPGRPRIGVAAVGRTAPDWVLLEDPAGDIHRIVLRGPGPEALRERNAELDPEDAEALAFFGLLWALSWYRH